MKKIDPNSAFYRELDQSKNKGSRCGCVSLVILFAILLFGIETALFLGARAIKARPSTSENLSSSVSLQEGQDASKFDLEGGVFQVVVSQGVLCARLKEKAGLKDVSCSISEEGIEISGKIGVLPQNTRAVLAGKIEKEKLAIELESLYIGKLKIPSLLTKNLSGQVMKVISNSAPDLDKANIQKVETREGVLIIEARKSG